MILDRKIVRQRSAKNGAQEAIKLDGRMVEKCEEWRPEAMKLDRSMIRQRAKNEFG